VALGDGCQHASQIGMWFYLDQFAGPNNWRELSLILCARIMARAERVLRFNAMGRMSRSTELLLISMRPSVRNRFKPPHYFAMYFCAIPVGDLAETCARLGALLAVQRD